MDYIMLRCTEMSNVEYEFLFNKSSRLLSIGYDAGNTAGPSCYDLLASEARFCSSWR